MSSSNKKTFKTSETTKAIDATVTSDAILLDPTTTDHVLVVTSETAGNLSGNVDVELEMSPDGENWCPAKVKQVTTTEETQGDPVEGNEKAVNLIKDTQDAGDYKNKFARGRLEYDLSTNQLYTGSTINEVERTDASDFMHHMIATNKNFNFSGWFNSDQQPSNTYTPVLFRHGGLDTFTNLKTVQLTDTGTQNLAEPQTTFTTTANTINAVNGQGNIFVDANSDAQNFYGAGGLSVTNGTESDIGKHLLGMFSPTQASSTSRWLYARSSGDQATWRNRGSQIGGYPFMNYVSTGNYVRYNGYLKLSAFNSYSANDAALKYLSISPAGVGGSGYWYVYDGNAINFTKRSDNTSLPVVINDGYHCAIVYTPPADITQGIPEANVAVYINGVRIKIRTTTESGVEYVEGAAPADNLYYGDETYAANSAWGGSGYLDYGSTYRYYSNINNHMDFQRALSESEVIKLYNKGQFLDFSNMQTSFPISLSNCVGAYDADVRFLGSNNTEVGFKDCSGFGKNVLTAPYNNSVSMTTTLFSPALEINAVPINLFKPDFSVDNDLSISGWFKTSNAATGTLFSNTGGAAATGLKMEVNANNMVLTLIDSSQTITAATSVNDAEWHHLVVIKPSGTTPTIKIYIDGSESVSTTVTTISNDDLRGDNGFTLLGDGQENANNASAASTDASKLQASLSNWSLHSEALSAEGIAQVYSNGHVRNIKNLPSVNTIDILAWWKLSDTTTPEEDLIGTNDLQFQDATSTPLSDPSLLVDVTGAPLVEKTLNGNGMTLSLTKKFDFVNEEWVTDASGEAAICLSFNGFEEQAEYFVLWKANQTAKSVNFLDGGWHNLVLSYRGRNDLNSDDDTTSSFVQEGDIVKFGNASSFNWNLSIDGKELNDLANGFGADYIGGLNTLEANNVGFAIYNRHLKFTGNSEETYIAHTQGGATPQVLNGVTVQAPLEEDTPYAFQGYIDETSFHSQNFWQTSTGGITVSNFESEYPAVIYGNTNALTLRGSSAPNYATGIPYPLNDATAIGALPNTSQYVNPDRLDPTTNPHGGLEAWWRWGDTPQDCAENINDAIDYALSTVQTPVLGHHLRAIEIDQGDLIDLSVGPASTYLADSDGTTPATAAVEFVNVVIQGIVNTACNVKDVADPILQYLRVKFKGAGSADLGPGKTEASLWYRKRRER